MNDYLASRDEKFFRYLDSRIDYVMRTGGEITLPNLTPYERKKAHAHISGRTIDGLKTFSIGEGGERALHMSYDGVLPERKMTPHTTSTWNIAPRKIAMTIDDEGVGI